MAAWIIIAIVLMTVDLVFLVHLVRADLKPDAGWLRRMWEKPSEEAGRKIGHSPAP